MKTRTFNREQKSTYVIVCREDFTAHALDLGIWDALIERMPVPTESVSILLVQREG